METNPGLHPALRALLGLALGALLGALVALLLPRDRTAEGHADPTPGQADAPPAA